MDEGRQTEKNDWDEQAGFFHGSSKSGIPMVEVFFVDDDIENGNLISLFADDIDETIGMYLLFPSHRQLSSAARVFMDFMAEQLNKKAE